MLFSVTLAYKCCKNLIKTYPKVNFLYLELPVMYFYLIEDSFESSVFFL